MTPIGRAALVGVLISLGALAASATVAFGFTCTGNPCDGTSGQDVIHGTAAFDGIRAFGSDDEVDANAHFDDVSGGPGADVVDGDGAEDKVFGDDGWDTVRGGAPSWQTAASEAIKATTP